MKNFTLLPGSLCNNSLGSVAQKNSFGEKKTVNAKSTNKQWLLMPLMVLGFLLTNGNAWGQFNTGTITLDGTGDEIAYKTVDGYSLAWDNTYLYIRYSGGGATEPVIFHIDVDPQNPVTGGANANGSLTGSTNWGITPTLPFRSDFVLYWESQLAEYRADNGTGGWATSGTSITTTDRSNTGTASREIRLQWTWMGLAGRPAAFNWTAFQNSRVSPGFIFGETPGENPEGALGTPTLNYYWTVSSTANDANITDPGTRKSFESRSNLTLSTANTFWDFTVNGGTLTNAASHTINNQLYIASGTLIPSGARTITFGSTSTNTPSLRCDGTLTPTNGVGNDLTITAASGTTTILGSAAASAFRIFSLNVNNGATVQAPSTGTVTLGWQFGTLTVASGGTLNFVNAGGGVVNLTNNATNSTVNISNSGTCTFNNVTNTGVTSGIMNIANNSTAANLSFNTLTNSAANTLRPATSPATSAITIRGSLVNNGTFITSNTGLLDITMTGAGSTNLAAGTYQNLTISNTGSLASNATAVTASGNIVIASGKTLTISSGARLDMGTNNLTLTSATSSISGFLRSARVSLTPITDASTTTLTFNNGGTFESNASTSSSLATALGLPIATWNSGSTCSVIGLTTHTADTWFGAGAGQTFSNFTWNTASMANRVNMTGATITCTGTFTMASTGTSQLLFGGNSSGTISCGNFTQSGGTINCSAGSGTGTITVTGTFNQSAGTITESSSDVAGNGTINLHASTGNQNVTQSGSLTNTINWNVGTGSSSNTATLLSSLTTPGSFTVNSGSTLAMAGFNLTAGSLAGAGTISSSTLTPILTCGSNGNSTTFSGTIGSGNISIDKTGAGTLTLSGPNTYGGTTTITAGTLALGASNVIPNGSAVSVASGAVLAMGSNSETVASIAGAGTISSASGTPTLTCGDANNTTFSGIIGTGAISLTKTGSGNLTLSNSANSYTGTTTISQGKIILNPSANATFASAIVLNGGTLSTSAITATRTWTSSSTLRLDANSTLELGSNAHTISFANSNGTTWNGNTLSITGWTGSAGSTGTAGKIFIGTDASGLTNTQLAKVAFPTSPTAFTGAQVMGTGELAPVGVIGTTTTTLVYNNPGSIVTFTPPCGVNSIDIEIFGAGGGGGGATRSTSGSAAGGGGTGGGYIKTTNYAVTALTPYNVFVGAGGSAGSTSGGNGGAGGGSYFVSNSTLFAVGGNGGTGQSCASNCYGTSTAAPASGNIGFTSPFNYYGGNGGAASSSCTPSAFSGGGGSSAGTAGNGNNGACSTGGAAPTGGVAGANGVSGSGGNGNDGTTKGSGGSGGHSINSTARNGGKGGDGQIIITYNNPATTTVAAASSTPTVCINTAMTSITHATTLISAISSSSGLPAGVSASYSGNVITISGTPTESGTFNYTITPNCGSATATGTITVVDAPTTSTNGGNLSVCRGTTSAALGGNTPSVGTGVWTCTAAPGGGNTSDITFTSSSTGNTTAIVAAGAVAGNYTLAWTISNSPCSSSQSTLTLTVAAAPTNSTNGGDKSVCRGTTSAALGGNTPSVGTGAWSCTATPVGGNTSDITFTSSSTGNTTAIVAAGAVAGNYTLAWTISNSPCSSSQSTLTLTVAAAPTTSTNGGNLSVCRGGTSAGLGGNTPSVGTGVWTCTAAPGGGSTSDITFTAAGTGNTTAIAASGAAVGAYTLTWTISNSPCTSSASTLTLTVVAPPTTSTNGGNKSVCQGGTSAALGGNTATVGTGAWSCTAAPVGGSTSSITFANSADGNTTAIAASNAVAGNYTLAWTISNSPCSSSQSTLTLTVVGTPTTSTNGGNNSVCQGGTSAALGGNTPSVGTGLWTCTAAPVGGSTSDITFTSSSTGNTTAIAAAGAVLGNYTLAWTISNSPCSSSQSTLTLTVNAPTSISTQPTAQQVCLGATANFTAAGTNEPTYAWRRRGSGWGTGNAWTLNAGGGNSGFFVGNSNSNAGGSSGINTSSKAFGIFNNNNSAGSAPEAIRNFSALQVGQTFQVDIDNGWVDAGAVGVGLQNSSGQNVWELFYSASGGGNYGINAGSISPALSGGNAIPFTGNGLRITLRLTSSTTYTVTIERLNGGGTYGPYTGSLLSPGGGQTITRFRAFNFNAASTNSGANWDFFFNNLVVGNFSDDAAAYTTSTWSTNSNLGQGPLANGATGNGSTVSGAATSSLSIATAASNDAANYDVVVYNSCGGQATSSAVALSFFESAPTITGQPSTSSFAYCVGQTPTNLEVTATGTGLTYQWWSSPNSNGSSGTNLGAGARDRIYAPLTSTVGTLYYYCEVTNSCGASTTSSVSGGVTVSTTANAGSLSGTQAICTSSSFGTNTTQLTPTVGGGSWSTSNAAVATVNSSGLVTAVAQGTATITYTVSVSGCSNGEATRVITVDPVPTTANAGPDQTVCAGTTINLAATPTTVGTGVWLITLGSGGNVNSGNSATSTFTGTTGTTYTLRWTTTGGTTCTSQDEVNITINPTTLTFVNLNTASATICAGGTFSPSGRVYEDGLTQAVGAGAGIEAQFGISSTNDNPSGWSTWTAASYTGQGGTGNNDDVYSITTGNTLNAGTYYYTFRYRRNGCSWIYAGYSAGGGGTWNGTTNVNGVLTVNAIPTPTFTAEPGASVCATTNVTYTTQASQTNYIWSVPGVANTDYTIVSGGIGTSNNTVTLQWLTTGSKTVTVGYTSSGCVYTTAASNTTTVNARPTPTFTAQAGATACTNTDVTYTTQSGQSNYVWSVAGTLNTDYSITSGGVGTSSNTVTLKWLTTGSKTVTINYTNAGGCAASSATSSTATTVSATPTPTFTAEPGASVCATTNVTYTTQASQTNYIWSVPGVANTDYTIVSGGIGTSNNTVTLQWLTTGSKTVTVGYTSSGCVYTTAASNTTTVNARPTPTFTAQAGSTACTNTDVTYTTESGQSNYVWSVPGTLNTDYSITSGGVGTSSNTVTLKWLTTGSKTVTINYTNAGGCAASSATSSTATTVSATPTPTFTAEPGASVCATTNVTYTTQASQTNYVWSVPGVANTDYTIISGGIGTSSNTVTLQWLTTGSKTVTVGYTSSGCVYTTAASNTTTVNARPTPTFTAQAGSTACTNTDVTYTTESGQSNYVWSVPGTLNTDYSITSGGVGTSSNTVTLKWLTTGSKTVTINYTNAGGCAASSATSSTATTVSATPTPTFTAEPGASVCANSNVTYTTQASQTNYIWSVPGTLNTDYSIISGGVGTSSNTVTLQWLTAGSKNVTVGYTSDGCASSTSASNTTTAFSTTTSIAPTLTQNITINTNGTQLTVSNGTNTVTSRQWGYRTTSGTGTIFDISGATSANYTPNFDTPGTYYVVCRVEYASPCSTTITSNEVTINVVSNSITTGTISGSPFCAGASGITVPFTYSTASNFPSGTTTFTAQLSDASGSFGSPVNLQSVGSDASGSQNISVTIPSNTTTGTGYRIRVVSNTPSVDGSDNGTDITINATSVGGTATATSAALCTSNSTTITLFGSTGSIQWQQSSNGTSGWADVTTGSGGTTSTYTTPNLTAITYYRAIVTSGVCNSSTSTTASVSIDATSVGGTATATSAALCTGNSTTISVTGFTGSIQWQQSANGSTGWANVTGGSGATSDTYTTPNLTATTYYRAVVTSGVCSSANSTTASVTISTASVGGTATATSAALCTGNSTTITLSGSTGSIQWQQSSNGTSGWADVTTGSGGTTSTYTTPNLTAITYYRAIVTSGVCNSSTSTTASVSIDATSVGGTATATSAALCTGNSTTISVTGYTGSIQWQQSANGSTGWANVTGGSGATTDTYTTPNLTATTYYRALVTSGVCSSANSTTASVTISVASVGGTATAASAAFCTGNSTTISLAGSTGSIQWQESANGSTGWANVTTGSGGTSSTYTTPNLTATTYYRAVVTSGVCTPANSTTASVTISPTSVGGTINSASVCLGATSGTLTLTGNTGTVTRWESATAPFSSWSTIASTAGLTSYTSGVLSQTTKYRAVVTSGTCASANSSESTVSVDQSNAASAAYSINWSNGQNDGATGFNAWELSATSGDGGQNGFFTGSSDINVNSLSWGLYANTGQTANAVRPFTSNMSTGSTLNFSIDNGTVAGSVGFGLRNSSGENLMEFYSSGGAAYTINDGAGANPSGISFTTTGLDISISYTAVNKYSMSVTPAGGGTTVYFTERSFLSSPSNKVPAQIRFFNFNAGSGGAANYYVNKLSLNRPAIGAENNFTTQTVCVGGTPNKLSVDAYGTELSYQWFSSVNSNGSSPTNLGSSNGAQTREYTPSTSSAGTLYYYCVVTGTCTSVTSNVSAAFIVSNVGQTWVGNTNSDWNTASNWSCGVVPTSVTNVTIPSGRPNSPNISTADAAANSITISSGATLTMSGGYKLTMTAGGTFTNNGTFTQGNGTVEFAGAGTVNGSTTTIFNNLITNTGTLTLTTVPQIDGSFEIKDAAVSQAPVYTSNSTLIYSTSRSRSTEWNANGIGTIGTTAGYPNNVTITGGTFSVFNTSTGTARAIARDLTVNSGATFTTGTLDALVTIGRDIINNGTITMGSTTSRLVCRNIDIKSGSTVTLSLVAGGDLEVTGDVIENGTLNTSGRALFFTGGATQNISGSNAAIDYIVSQKSAGSIVLGSNLTITSPANGSFITLTNATDIIDLNGYTLTLGSSTFTSSISGNGLFRGGGNSSLIINGGGNIGTIRFVTTTPGTTNALKDLTINRVSSGAVTLGSDLVVTGTATLTSGLLNIGSFNLTFGASATAVAGTPSASNMIVATGSGEVRKVYSAAGSFTFPVGDNTGTAEYSPATLNFTSGSFSSSTYAGVKLVNLKYTPNTSTTDFIRRYWTVTSDIASPVYTPSFTYADGDIAGTETNLYGGRYLSSTWNCLDQVNASTNTFSKSGITAFGDFTAGEFGVVGCCINPTTAGSISGDQTICSGGDPAAFTSVSAPTGASGALEYKWQFSSSATFASDINDIASSNSATYDPPANLTAMRYYRRLAIVACKSPDYTGAQISNILTVTVNAVPSITSQPSGATICSGGTFSPSITATGGTSLSFAWQYSTTSGGTYNAVANNTPLNATYSGGATNALTVTGSIAAGSGYWYRCVVSDPASGCTTQTSTAVQLTVNAVPSVTVQPANATICVGGTYSPSITATGGTSLTYAWQYATSLGGTYNAVANGTPANSTYSGEATNQLTVSGNVAAGSGYWYRCVVSDAGSGCSSVTSSAVRLTVNAVPAISSQPTAGNICVGGTYSPSITATGGTGLTYAWQYSTTSGGTYNAVANNTPANATYSGGATNQLTVSGNIAAGSGYWYRCVVSDAGSGCSSVTSTAVQLTVNTVPAISVQPTAGNICVGGTYSPSITATGGTTLTYAWQYATSSGGTYNAVANGTPTNSTYSGEATNQLTVSGNIAAGSGYWYRCVVSDAASGCSSVTSSAVQLTVNAVPAISVQPTAGTICEGGSYSPSVTATGGTSLTYAWQYATSSGGTYNAVVNGTPANSTYSGAATNQLTVSGNIAAGSGYWYRCVVSDAASGCSSVTSSAVQLTVNANPTAAAGSALSAICQSGTSAQMGGSVAGGATGGTWSGGAGSWTNADNPSTATYTAGASESGSITLTLTTSGGSCGTTTATKTITVNPNPTAVNAGNDVTICSGGSANLSGSASGGTCSASDYTNSTQSSIPDGDLVTGVTSTINVPQACGVASEVVSVTVNITHTFSADLDIYLVAPDGTEIALATDKGSSGDGYACTFVTGGSALPGGAGPGPGGSIAGNYAPQQAFSSLGSGRASGDWKLKVFDDGGGSTGSLTSWSIRLNTDPKTYTWINNTTGLSATNISYPTATPSSTTTYTMRATLNGCSATDNVVVTVRPTFTAGDINTTGETICSGGNPTLIGSATDASGGDNNITYQWQSSTTSSSSGFTNITGATSSTYDPPAGLTQTTWYRRQARDGVCNTTLTNSTGTWQVTVIAAFTSGTISSTGQTICYGGTPSQIGSTTAASGGDGSITYSWRSSADSYTNPIDGATSATYTPPAGLITTTSYRRYAKDGTCNTTPTVSTGTWTVTVRDQFTSGAINITGQTICYAGTPSQIGSATAASGGNNVITYSWRSSADNYTAAISGATAATYTPPAGLTTTTSYQRYARDGVCNTTATVSTGTWTVTVRAQFTSGEISSTGETICYGGTPATQIGSSTVASGGDNSITYTWRSSADGYTNAIGGATAATYTPPAGLTTTTSYRRYANDGLCNTTPTVSTGTWTVTVRDQFTSGAISTTGQSICSGGTPSEIGSATAASGGNNSITYTWRSSADGYTNAIGGATSATYTPPAGLTTTTSYRRYANDGLCNTSPTVSTGTWTVTVNENPQAPSGTNGSRCGTGTVTISATPGAGETIDWYGASTGGSVLTTGTPNPASGTTSFTTPSISVNTVYYAQARNTTTGCVSATRTEVTASLNASPSVSITGQSSICAGATTTLSPTTGGTWTSSNTNVATVDINTGVVTGVSEGTATFTFTLTAGGCSNTTASVTIKPNPSALSITGNSGCVAGTITSTTSQNGVSYTLYDPTAQPVLFSTKNGTGSGLSWTNIPFDNGYFVVATLNNCSTNSNSVNVTAAAQALSITGSTICQGNSDGTITSTTSVSGVNYQLYNSSNLAVQVAKEGTGSALTWTGLSAGTGYYVTSSKFVSPDTCTANSNFVNISTVSPSANAGSALSAICQSGTSAQMGGSVGGTATGGTWSGGAGSWTNADNPATATYTAGASESGSITLTLTTSGGSCGTTTATKTITVNANPTATISGTLSGCVNPGVALGTSGSAAGSGTISGYQWKLDGNDISGATNSTYTATASGSYTVVVTNSNSCSTTSSANAVTANANPTAPTAGSVTQPTCTVATGSFQINSYDPARDYLFTPSSGVIVSGSGLVTAPEGSYTFTVNNAAGCTSSASTSIVVNAQPATPSAPTAGSVTQPTCTVATGTFQINSYDSERTYTFTPSTGVSVSGSGLVTAPEGSYTFTVNNAAGCTSSASTSIEVNAQPATPTVTFTAQPGATACASTDLTYTTQSGQSSYAWSVSGTLGTDYSITSGGTSSDNTVTLKWLTSGSKTVTVNYNNASGCTAASATSSTETNIQIVTWSNGSWSPTAPTATTSAVIQSQFETSENISACSLRVTNSATVVVLSGVVTLNGPLIAEPSSSFVTFNNNSILLQNGSYQNTGNIRYKKTSSPIFRLDYTLWSSPLTDPSQPIFSFSPQTLTNRFYTYNEALYRYTTNDMYTEGNPALSWSSSFQKGRGYLIRSPNNWVSNPGTAAPWTGTFTGVPNNGDINVTIYSTLTTEESKRGYNAVGNPYPSPISIDAFFEDNSERIDPALWFWRKTNGVSGSAYINYISGSFQNGLTNELLDPQPIDVIQPGQGFFVRAKSTGTLQFNNSQRVDTNGTFSRYNTQTTTVGGGRLWLNLKSNSVVVGSMAIGYKEGATNDLDANFDGEYINDSALALSSLIQGKELSVQHRAAPFVDTDVVPLSFKTDVAGTYSIDFNGTDGVLNTQDIYLEDLLLGQSVAIKTTPYTFATEVGTFSDRFRIVYTNNALGTDVPVFNANQVVIYKNEINDFVINSGNVIMSNIKVFDIRGRLLQEYKNVNDSQTTINVGSVNQVILVQITSEDGVMVTKKVIR